MKLSKSIFAVVFAATLFCSNVNAADTTILANENPAELTVVSTAPSATVVSLIFKQGEADKSYTVSVTDQSGFVLFSGVLKASEAKQFLLNTEELGDQTITFKVVGKETGAKQSFVVNTKKLVTQQTEIVKL